MIDGQHGTGPSLALFDFDGTLTTREMLPDFFRMAIPRPRLLIGQLLLAPLVIGYRLGLVSGVRVRAAIVRVGMTGMAVAHYERAGRRFADEVLPGVLRPQMMARLQWHLDRGDRVVVVSGAFDVYLRHWCDARGLELVCSSLETAGGRLTGRYQGRQCVRAEKSRRVLACHGLSAYRDVHAYGDTAEDEELLALAQHQWYRGTLRPATTQG